MTRRDRITRLGAAAVLAGAGVLVVAALAHPARRPLTVVASRPVPPRAARPPHRPPIPAAIAPRAYAIKRVLSIPSPFVHGQHYWDERGVPDGPVVITIDLAAETLSVFRGGYEIGTAVVIYGYGAKATPLGVFTITQKDADHVSNIYDAPMPYMLRLTNDGVSIHGSDIAADYATHGCVGVPVAFARKLFGAVKLGDRVIVTNGERLKLGEAIPAA